MRNTGREDHPLQTLRFILVLAIGGALMMGLRAIDPWIVDRIAVDVALAFVGMALIAAVVGLLRA